ncbi:hypothetical protein ERO13_D04G179150v2 [Gossypium hirsutum]|nr:hypothetical protein ERO13_D04G179150v2 [Gossypium hirsutum]
MTKVLLKGYLMDFKSFTLIDLIFLLRKKNVKTLVLRKMAMVMDAVISFNSRLDLCRGFSHMKVLLKILAEMQMLQFIA